MEPHLSGLNPAYTFPLPRTSFPLFLSLWSLTENRKKEAKILWTLGPLVIFLLLLAFSLLYTPVCAFCKRSPYPPSARGILSPLRMICFNDGLRAAFFIQLSRDDHRRGGSHGRDRFLLSISELSRRHAPVSGACSRSGPRGGRKNEGCGGFLFPLGETCPS